MRFPPLASNSGEFTFLATFFLAVLRGGEFTVRKRASPRLSSFFVLPVNLHSILQWRFYSNFDPLIFIVCLFCLDFSTIFWHFCFIVWTYAIKHSRLKNKARSVNLPSFPQNTVLWGKWQPWWYDSRTENIIFSVYFILFFYNTKFFFFFKILLFVLWKNF